MREYFEPAVFFLTGVAVQPLLALMEDRMAVRRNLDAAARPLWMGLLLSAGCGLAGASLANRGFLMLELSLCWIATMFDLKYRIIPNTVILAMLATAAVFALIGETGAGIPSSLAGLAVVGLLFVFPYLFGKKVGAGDVKLAAAIGFCAGLQNALQVVMIMGVLVIAYFFLIKHGALHALKQYIPMGPFVTAAYFLLLIR